MKCIEVEKHLENLLDGEISSAISNEINLHIDLCESCCGNFDSLKTVSNLLKKSLPVSPSIQFDNKIFDAFKQANKKESVWNWATIFGEIVLPKPALAFALLSLFVFSGVAFQLGRMSAAKTEIMVSTPENLEKLPVPIENNNPPKVVEVVKYVEVPTTKYIKVPVTKEKIVKNTIYRTIEKYRDEKKQTAQNIAVKTENDSQLDLNDFQPISEMNPKILKKGETNEK